MSTTNITPERKAELSAKGFYIEDMKAVWGEGWWDGSFRWMKKGSDEFQDGDVSSSEENAWKVCDAYDRETSVAKPGHYLVSREVVGSEARDKMVAGLRDEEFDFTITETQPGHFTVTVQSPEGVCWG
jgi:hypothetical protein